MLSKQTLLIIFQIIIFFLVETFFYNEILLFLLLVLAAFYKYILRKNKGLNLFITGCLLGFFIEWYLGNFARSQYWANTLFFSIPVWLPLAWGYGFGLIHELGNILDSKNYRK